MVRQADIRADLRCCRVDLPTPQCREKVTRKNHPLSLAPGKPLPDQLLDATIHGFANLAAEAAGTQGHWLTGNKLAIEPRRTSGLDLILDRQVRAHRERDALEAGRIFEPAQLDDAAQQGVARRVKIGQADMVSTSVDPVDHGVGCPSELV